jgi:serine/threonine protein kinase
VPARRRPGEAHLPDSPLEVGKRFYYILRAEAIGPATGLWALAAILCEMPVSRPPFQGTGVRETLDLVRRQDPVPVRRLRPRCPRDLEAICLKCPEKDPARRHPSAAALADDLDRFPDGRPVLARRPVRGAPGPRPARPAAGPRGRRRPLPDDVHGPAGG